MADQDLENQAAIPPPPVAARNEGGSSVAPEAGSDAAAPPGKWARMKAAYEREYEASKIKIEPTDGYTTYSFNTLPRPLPVKDFMFGARTLIILRLFVRGFIFAYPVLCFSNSATLFVLLFPLGLTLLVCFLQAKGVRHIRGFNIPRKRDLWSYHRFTQWIWERIFSRLLLRNEDRQFWVTPLPVHCWWFVYFQVSSLSDFERNFLNAWDLKNASTFPPPNSAAVDKTPTVTIFVEEEQLDAPIFTHDADDAKLLKELRMFYRYMKMKRGFTELVLPRELTRIDSVKIEPKTYKAGTVTDSLDCGRNLQLFHDPDTATGSDDVTNRLLEVQRATPREGLEFIRGLDRMAIGAVILAPPIASLAFITIWLSIWLKVRKPADGNVHPVVGSAFAVASFMVTAGGFIIALTVFLENKEKAKEASSKDRNNGTRR